MGISTFVPLTQRGVIVFGNGLNARYAMDAAKAEGYVVLIFGAYAELYR